jgi:hypothetical protein
VPTKVPGGAHKSSIGCPQKVRDNIIINTTDNNTGVTAGDFIPSSLNAKEWGLYRKEIKEKLSPRMVKHQLKFLSQQDDPCLVIRHPLIRINF